MARTASGDPQNIRSTSLRRSSIQRRGYEFCPGLLRDIENGMLFRPQGIIHALPATSLPSAKFERIQAAPYLSLEGHLNEASVIASRIHLFAGCPGSPTCSLGPGECC